jgi:hypothetical protein
MDQTINERWLQFAFINSKGNINKTALKIPFHAPLDVDDELPVLIGTLNYVFICVAKETKTNNNGTVDEIYVVATNNQ